MNNIFNLDKVKNTNKIPHILFLIYEQTILVIYYVVTNRPEKEVN